MGRFPSGQREQTVNLSAKAFGGSNPPLPIAVLGVVTWAGIAQLARASAFQAEGRGFESRFPLFRGCILRAHVAQSVEHFLGKEEVTGSSPVVGFTMIRGLVRL